MVFTENQIESLRLRVKGRLSKKRFLHTLGVEDMAIKIGKICLPEKLSELRVAALLHDISKEYSEAEQLEIAKRHNLTISDEDLSAPPLWHSFTAPLVVLEDFAEYVTDDVLCGVRNHTVGSPDMSVFDEIILISDYIEEGRTYKNCIELRECLLSELDEAEGIENNIFALHRAVVRSLDNNINEFISRGKNFHSKTKLTRDAIYEKSRKAK